MTPARIASGALAAALAWRLAASAADAGDELTGSDLHGRSLRERLAAVDEPLAARERRSFGVAAQLLDAVRESVPEEATLAVGGARIASNANVALALYTMLWPRRIVLLEDVAREDLERGSAHDRPLHVLRLEGAPPFDPRDRYERVDGSRRFELWRPRGAPR